MKICLSESVISDNSKTTYSDRNPHAIRNQPQSQYKKLSHVLQPKKKTRYKKRRTKLPKQITPKPSKHPSNNNNNLLRTRFPSRTIRSNSITIKQHIHSTPVQRQRQRTNHHNAKILQKTDSFTWRIIHSKERRRT